MPAEKKVNRNDPCPCGSGKKYKQCCLKQKGGKRSFTAKVLGKEKKPEGEEPYIPPLEQKVDLMERAFGKVLQQNDETDESEGEKEEGGLEGRIKKKTE